MRVLIFAVALTAGFTVAASAQSTFTYGTGSNSSSHYVQPHYNNNGSFTGGHYRTNPDSTRSNNYGSYGNFNSHTGGVGDGYGRSKRY